MKNISREEIEDLIEDVTRLRKEQPKIIQEMYTQTTLCVLHKVKVPKSPKPVVIPTVPSVVSKTDIEEIIQDTKKIENKLIEQVQVLQILSKKKNCALSKVFTDSD